jgi:hypothetical protein
VGCILSLKLRITHTINEPSTLEIIRKMLLTSPGRVVEVLGVVGVTHLTLQTPRVNQARINQGINRILSSVRQHGTRANLCNYFVEGVELCVLRLSHKMLKGQETCDLTHVTALYESGLILNIEKRCRCVSNQSSKLRASRPL